MNRKDLPVQAFARAEWAGLLAANGPASRGLWLDFAKTGVEPPPWKPEAIETAIAHGWWIESGVTSRNRSRPAASRDTRRDIVGRASIP